MGKRGKRGKQKNKTKERNLARERARAADKQLERLTKAIRKSQDYSLALFPWLQSHPSAASSADTIPTPDGVVRVSLESDSDTESNHALSDSEEAQETCGEFAAHLSDEPPQG